MNINDKVILWLSLADFLTPKKVKNLLSVYDTAEKLWDFFDRDYSKFSDIITESEWKKLSFLKDDNYLTSYIKNLDKQNIKIVTMHSNNYPKALLETDNPPLLLYCKGNLELLNTDCLAVVGTRRPTKYGKDVTYDFVKAIVNAGVTIVSGLADGIDTVAHEAALEVGGNTIAVLGSGINEIYPYSNIALSNKIFEKGLVISEYKPNDKPQQFYFPSRNRIIAGISSGVLITEAGEKSGSMHTKNYAVEYNRNLFVIPGRIYDKYSKGCNTIIKNLQASLVLQPEDILQTYGLTLIPEKQKVVQLDLDDEIVLSIITREEVHYEEILVKSNLESKKLNTTLIRLELKGLIKKLSGNYYSK